MIIGIDPGQKGAIATLTENGILRYDPMPTKKDIRIIKSGKRKGKTRHVDILDPYRIVTLLERIDEESDSQCHVVLERQIPYFGGKMQCYEMGANMYGLIYACHALHLSFIIVTPQQWKSRVLVGMPWRHNKLASVDYVKQRYPSYNLTNNDGIADAICIALYGKSEGLT